MHANRSTLVKLCLLTALAVPVQRAASAANQQTFEGTRAKAEATQLLIAQASSEFTLPASLNDGEPLLIDGSSSMRSMNEALTAQFTERFPDAVVDSEASGTDIALQRLQDDEIELAAIGRPLTEAEKDSGLTAVNIAREKIAIFVAPDSPFDGDLTFGQFGQIFRGEITDWSDISDEAAGPIRFVDRPAFSDTRQAFQPYPVFQEAPFETGANADPVSTDETEAVIDALGEDGLGYAIANQVMGNDSVKIVPMHQTLPDDQRYPFSQPRSYVYKGEPSDAVKGFLAIATSPEGQTVVEEVRETEGAAAAQIEGPTVTATSPDGTLTAVSNEDNVAVIVDESGDPIAAPLAGAGGAITALAFSEDGQTLATGTNTGKVRFWGVDGEPKGDVFKPSPDGNAITELQFDGNDKLSVASEGRRGFWGLNGLPFGETAVAGGAAATAAAGKTAADRTAGSPWWWWLIPLLGLLGLGAWLLGKRRRSPVAAEPRRQTSPTATVTPPTTDPESDRPVSSRAQTVIKTDRVTDESRVVAPPTVSTAASESAVPLPVGSPGDASPPVSANLPDFESTDLESPNLEGTNLDLLTPGAVGGAIGGAAVLGGMAAAGLSAETEDDDDEEWDDNLDLTLDDAPVDSEAEIDMTGEVDTTVAPIEQSTPIEQSIGAPPPLETQSAAVDTTEDFWNTSSTEEATEDLSSLDAIEPTPDMIVADTRDISDIEPTESTIIGESAVIGTSAATFGGAAAVETTAEAAVPNPSEATGSDTGRFANAAEPTRPEDAVAGEDLSASPGAGDIALGVAGAAAGSAVAAGIAAGATQSIPTDNTMSKLTVEELASVDEGLAELPDGYGVSRIVLLPRDPKWSYAYWDISNEHKEELRQRGGQKLMLRLYDVTDIDQTIQTPHSMQQQDCHEMARSWYLEVPVSDRDYSVEIGYLTADDRWLLLARSAPIRVPPIYPSDWVKDQFVTIGFDESLQGRTFGSLGRQPDPDVIARAKAEANESALYNELFALSQGHGLGHMAGSLFGSMHQLAPGALSPSGNVSGLNMSGLNVSGLTMSGIGMADRKRNFWLVADAELIVYGATEPDATLTVGDRVIPLNPDGTFRFHVAFPDGQIDYPIKAVAVDGEQSRSISMHFERDTPERNTNTKAEAKDEWF